MSFTNKESEHLRWDPIFIQERDPDWWENVVEKDGDTCVELFAIKLHKVFLSKYCDNMHLHMLILFYHHMHERQVSHGSMIHAGRYLDDKEVCYLTTVILTANV